MLEGYQRYIKRGHFLQPESCKTAKAEWLSEANNVIRFVNENFIKGDGTDRLGLGASIYNRYERWCECNGVKPKGRNNFYGDLTNMDYSKRTSTGNKIYIFGGTMAEEIIDDFDDL